MTNQTTPCRKPWRYDAGQCNWPDCGCEDPETRKTAALERVLIGGNHLALLIGPDHPPYTATHDDAMAHYQSNHDAYEAWCCWRTIMERFAMSSDGKSQTTPWPHPGKQTKLWLWKNGDHYLAFDNPMPCYPDGGDPLVAGEPVAIAVFMPSTCGWKLQ